MKIKITESNLKELVEQEIQLMIETGEIDEGFLDRMRARGASAITKIKGASRGALQKGLGALAGAAGEEEMAATMKGAATSTAATTKAAAHQAEIKSILGKNLRNLESDLINLDIADDPRVRVAFTAIMDAVMAASAEKGATDVPEPADVTDVPEPAAMAAKQ